MRIFFSYVLDICVYFEHFLLEYESVWPIELINIECALGYVTGVHFYQLLIINYYMRLMIGPIYVLDTMLHNEPTDHSADLKYI